MTWHLQPSGYALLWTLSFCGYVLFWLWKIEMDRYRAVISLVLIFMMAVILGVAIHAL